MKKPRRRVRLSHTRRYTEKVFKPYTALIGQVALAWNDLHVKLGLLFGLLCSQPSDLKERNLLFIKAFSVWLSSSSDRASRSMLKAALHSIIDPDEKKKYPRLGEDVDWLLTEVGKLEDARNNVVHSPLLFLGESTLVPELSFTIIPDALSARGRRLSGKNLIAEYKWCRNTALTLRDYTEIIRVLLERRVIGPWPDRPKLPNRGQKRGPPTRPRRPRPKSRPRLH